MDIRLALFLCLLSKLLDAAEQDASCDFYYNVTEGQTYDIYSPNYPQDYSAGVQCLWIGSCPKGYNCLIDCPEVRLPESESCSMDRLLVSRTGDPQLVGAQYYCEVRNLSIVSTGQRISLGLISSPRSPGGRFYCQLKAQPASPTPEGCRCGERRQNRIVGGRETSVNEYPMMARIVERNFAQIKCGGVIISYKHVLTAAHCVMQRSVGDLVVVVGQHNVTIGNSPANQVYKIASFMIHPQFTESNYDYDIAIVTTTTPIVFSELVLPACLPFKYLSYSFAGDSVTVLGWGTQFPGGPTSDVLMEVDLTVISQKTCKSAVSTVTTRQMCTYTPGKGACQGDSGGPLLYTDRTTGLLFCVGIVSTDQCSESSFPRINTRVTPFLKWVVVNTVNTGAVYCYK